MPSSSWSRNGAAITLVCRWILAAVLLYAGALKVIEPETTQAAIAFLLSGLGPLGLTMSVALLAAAEIWIGLSLLLNARSRTPAVVAFGLLAVVTVGHVSLRSNGFLGACGCATPIDALFAPTALLWRNTLLGALTVTAFLGPRPGQRAEMTAVANESV